MARDKFIAALRRLWEIPARVPAVDGKVRRKELKENWRAI